MFRTPILVPIVALSVLVSGISESRDIVIPDDTIFSLWTEKPEPGTRVRLERFVDQGEQFSPLVGYFFALDQAGLLKSANPNLIVNFPRALKLLNQISNENLAGAVQLAKAYIVFRNDPRSPLIRESLINAMNAKSLDLGEAKMVRAWDSYICMEGSLSKRNYIGYLGQLQTLPTIDCMKYFGFLKSALDQKILTLQEIGKLGVKIQRDAEINLLGHAEVCPVQIGLKLQKLAISEEKMTDRTIKMKALDQEIQTFAASVKAAGPTDNFYAIFEEAIPPSIAKSDPRAQEKAFIQWYAEPENRKRWDAVVEQEPFWKALQCASHGNSR